MPPPSYCSKVSNRSGGDHEPKFNDIDNSKSENSNFSESTTDDECNFNDQYDSVGIVKSLLGPSLEDAVLRTLEFGKSLIQKTEEYESKRMLKPSKKNALENSQKQSCDILTEEESRPGMTDGDLCQEGKVARKRLVFTADLDKNAFVNAKPNSSVKKLTNVSKIRSLDSDLKQVSPSPEKIKRQLEALIQIHKDDPTEPFLNWNVVAKPPKLPMEMTVMPTFCNYKNETDLNCSSSCDVQSQGSRRNDDGDPCSTSRIRASAKKRLGAPNKICQAPEFLSNALGPTLDVSIIDNLKMMRDIFKCDSAKGEGTSGQQELPKRLASPQMRTEVQVRLQQSEEEMCSRIKELQRTIEELEGKEQCLVKQIEEENCERERKRREFEEEEQKLRNMKACMDELIEQKTKDGKTTSDAAYEAKYECLQQRIAVEEEKLARLKEQHECYKREICEAKNKKEAVKRNKSLLDAWDVIASRVCHTRLPSFSKACALERKTFQPSETSGSIHCCLPMQLNQPVDVPNPCGPCGRKSRSRSRCGANERCTGQCQSSVDFCWSGNICKEHGSPSPHRSRKKHEDIPFPIQRDITCGLHQSLKTCSCSHDMKIEGLTCSSEDDLLKKYAAHGPCRQPQSCCHSSSLDTSAEALLRKSPQCGKAASRSKSDTTMRNKNSKIVKVMWAVTRINIFQDNCRTYEVMDATSNPPSCPPARTEGIFVVKSSQKKSCQTPPKKKCHKNFSGL